MLPLDWRVSAVQSMNVYLLSSSKVEKSSINLNPGGEVWDRDLLSA